MTDACQVPGPFVITWIDTRDGTRGHSNPDRPVSYETARAWVDEMNRKYPYINHAECSLGELKRFMSAEMDNKELLNLSEIEP